MAANAPALVVGLDCITGLQTARILARRGVRVIGIARDLGHFCCKTRVCERIFRADTTTDDLIERLEAIGPTLEERGVLVACTDATVLLLSRHRDRLHPWYHVVLPDPDVVEMLMDKVSFYEYADREGLRIPRTLILAERADAERAAATLRFPCVVKPPLKTSRWEAHATAKAYKTSDPEALLALYDQVAGWTDVLLAQEWIDGQESSLYSCNCYFDSKANPVVTFVARKIRQWPPETGTSSLGEECRNDAVLSEAMRLFKGVGLRGLGYLEMKRDARTGDHFIVEPNIGRPTGRSAIAEAGGVELLYTMYCDSIGLPLPEKRHQRYGNAKWIYLRWDLQSAFVQWRRGQLTISDWWRSLRGAKTDAVFSSGDPGPFVFDLLRAVRLAMDFWRHQRTPARPTPS